MTALSFEFYPPKTDDQRAQLDRAANKLKVHAPEYVSCTFGAGGSTLSYTSETVRHLNQHHGFEAAPHLSCVGGTREEIRELLKLYRAIGVKRIVALRGDLPSGMGGDTGELHHAADLVRFVREHYGDHFHIEVAAYPEMHPQAESAAADLRHFVDKVRAGADGAITQYFFNPDAYFDFVDRARAQGVDIPVTPGIMPVTNYTQLARFSSMCGAEIPRWMRLRLQDFGDDKASIRAFGIDMVTRLVARLLEQGAPGAHFYTLNNADAVAQICADLGLDA